MTPIVHTITLQQPWAWAVMHAGKDIENRFWRPMKPFLMLVHAGKKWDPEGADMIQSLGIALPGDDYLWPEGVIVGAVRVTGWQDDSPSPWAIPGQWHWNLEGPMPVTRPIACRGRPGFFPPPPGWKRGFTTRRR